MDRMSYILNQDKEIRHGSLSEVILSKCDFNSKTITRTMIGNIGSSLDEFAQQGFDKNLYRSIKSKFPIDSLNIFPSAYHTGIHYVAIIHDHGYRINLFVIKDHDVILNDAYVNVVNARDVQSLVAASGNIGFRITAFASFYELDLSGNWARMEMETLPLRAFDFENTSRYQSL